MRVPVLSPPVFGGNSTVGFPSGRFLVPLSLPLGVRVGLAHLGLGLPLFQPQSLRHFVAPQALDVLQDGDDLAVGEYFPEGGHPALEAGNVRGLEEFSSPADVGVEGAVSVVPGVSVSVQRRCRQYPVGLLNVPVGLSLPACSMARGAVGLEDSLAWRCVCFLGRDSRSRGELGRRSRWRLRGWPRLCWRRCCRCRRPGCGRRVCRGDGLSPSAARKKDERSENHCRRYSRDARSSGSGMAWCSHVRSPLSWSSGIGCIRFMPSPCPKSLRQRSVGSLIEVF